ncbi:MAG: hypothetical protein ACT4PU_04610 [Planctomycetota bacterium]
MARLAGLAALFTLAVVLFTAIRPVWTIDPDASLYVSLGRSLALGDGYALEGVPHTKYPPGWPAVLAALIRLSSPDAYEVFHAFLVCALLACAWLSYVVARRLGYPPIVAVAAAIAVGLSQTFFDLSVVYLRTETLFTALCLASLLLLCRGLEPRAGPWPALAAGLLIVCATSVRLVGVALLAVPAIALLSRHGDAGETRRVRLRALLILALGLTACAAWQWRTTSLDSAPGATNYSSEFRAAEPRDLTKVVRLDMPTLDMQGLARRVMGNLEVMTRALAVLLTNVDSAAARLPVGALLLALVLAGAHQLWWRIDHQRIRRAAVLFAAALIGLTLIWPFNQQERFYAPLLPLLVLMAGEGLTWAWRLALTATARPSGRAALWFALAALVVLLAAQKSDRPTILNRYSPSYAALLVCSFAGAGLCFWLSLKGALPRPRTAFALVIPVLMVIPFANRRFVEWPQAQAAFLEHRAKHPVTGALASIDVDPRLESVAIWLREQTPSDSVLMTDVPRMLQIMSDHRCVPFVYSVNPPTVHHGSADYVFYTREIAEAAAVMDAVAEGYEPVFELEAIHDGQRLVTPTVYRPR